MRTRVATIEAVRSDLLAKPRDKRSYGPTRSRSRFGLQREKSQPRPYRGRATAQAYQRPLIRAHLSTLPPLIHPRFLASRPSNSAPTFTIVDQLDTAT